MRSGHALSGVDGERTIAGRYRVEAPLGKGGAAQVFRVSDLSTGRELALKLLSADASKTLTSQFELEYQTLASLKHARTVEVYEYGRDGDAAFYTMELLRGEDLKGRAPISWREACGYLRDAAQALGPLHARKLVHRDISPRNLWRMPDGRVKLIDFGALAPFGPADHLMGTPPLVPPEAFYGRALDQRSDLYALGAVAYYLLTGLHAFPARDLRELPELWQTAPLAPSKRVSELARPDLDSVPPELDLLITSLISETALARPTSTAEVIDRIDALCGGARPSQSELAETHLQNSAFVGRRRERKSLRRQLVLAAHGRGQSCVVESEPGLGRSRLLRELSLEARVAPATVLHVNAAAFPDVYGVANALALQLLDALPEAARAAADPLLATLAHVSPRLRERLTLASTPLQSIDELRVRIQAALRDWFLAVASSHTLVVLVDGLELVDEGSAAFLLALAMERKSARLLLATTLVRERARETSAVERALQKISHPLVLGPLDEPESAALLASVFGEAENLGRLASRIHRATSGNPGHMLELSGQLVRKDVIGFVEGVWVLPQEVPDELLTSSREEALASRLDLLSPEARELGRVLSVHVGTMSLDLAKALARSASESLFLRLGELLEHDVLLRSEEGIHFEHEQFRLALLLELTAERRRSAQRELGEYLLALPELRSLDRARAGLHLLQSGDARGGALIAQASLRMALYEGSDNMRPGLPIIEEALVSFRADGRPNYELLSLLGPLSIGGYYADRRYAARYGDLTMEVLQELLGLNLARKLSTFIGRKLGLIVALIVAGVRFRIESKKNPRVPAFREAMLLLFNSVATLTGTSIVCLDAQKARRYASALEPFSALGPNHIASFMYEFCSALADTANDTYGATSARWERIIERLESAEPIKGLIEVMRPRYIAGALYASGVLDTLRDDERALQKAERLEHIGLQLYKLSADQLRAVYYANQGNAELFERYRERAEQHAIQQGTIWQVEMWWPSVMTTRCLRTQDAMAMKHTAEQLQRVSQEIPAVDVFAQRARGAYLLLRKKYAEALPWLEAVLREQPRENIGWGRSHAALARAYNRLGEYGRARDVLMRVHALFNADDFAFSGLNLSVQTELLIAEAGLGRGELAQRGLEELIAVNEPKRGPLTMGQLHDAGVELALMAADEVRAERHLKELERWVLPTKSSSLAQRCETLRKGLTSTQRVGHATGEDGHITSSESIHTAGAALTVDRLLAGGSMSIHERAHKALQVLAESTRCTDGFLYLLDERAEPRLAASLQPNRPSEDVERWLAQRIAGELEEEMTQMVEDDDDEDGDKDASSELNVVALGGRYYRLLLLFATGAKAQGVVGAALFAAPDATPEACPADVLGSVGYHLQRAVQQERPANWQFD